MNIKKLLLSTFIFINILILPANAMHECSNPHHNIPHHHERPVHNSFAHHPHYNFGICTRNINYLNTIYYDDYFIHPFYNGFKDINLIFNFRI